MANKANKSGGVAANEFVDSLHNITDSLTEVVFFGLIADRLIEGMIEMRIPSNVAVKALEELIKLLKKSPGYEGE